MGKEFVPHHRRFLPKRSPNKHQFPRKRQAPEPNRCGICRAPMPAKATRCANCGCGWLNEQSI